jgi:CheY-like chemotaxis protein
MDLKIKYKVLFAEDDPPVRELISEVLADNNFDVLEAVDGKEAIDIYKSGNHKIDVIVSDLRMPNVSGEEFAKFNYENENLPFVVCTAYSDAKLALSLLKYGVQDYVVKPIKEDNFVRVIKSAVIRGLDRKLDFETNEYKGNVGFIEIHTVKNEIYLALDWIRGEIQTSSLHQKERSKYLGFISEFLLNAYEHGNLKITEKEKSQLLEEGKFESEKISREKNNNKKITVSTSVLDNEIAVNIKDEGDGFDYNKYLKMTDDELLERLEMPNGRGIYMSTTYFSSIEYSDGGRSVQLVKSTA